MMRSLKEKFRIWVLAKRRIMVGAAQRGSKVSRIAARVACRIIDAAIASGTADLDMLARLQALVGAAGLPESAVAKYSRNPAKGLQKIKQEHFQGIDLDPSWTSRMNTRIIDRMVNQAEHILGDRNPSGSGYDIAINFLSGYGFGADPIKTRLEFHKLGMQNADLIKSGGSPKILGDVMMKYVKGKALNWLKKEKKRETENIDVGGTGRGDEEGPSTKMTPRKREAVLQELMAKIPREDPHARELDKIIMDYLNANQRTRAFQMTKVWYDEFRKTGESLPSKHIGDLFGVNPEWAKTGVKDSLNQMMRYLAKNTEALNIADAYLQAQAMGYGRYASKKK